MRRYLILSLLLLSNISFAQNYPQRWRIKPTQEELEFRKSLPQHNSANKTSADWDMPADARFPAEFEESQAVAIAWPYDYNNPTDIDVTTYYGYLWAQMTDVLQKECPVWIRVTADADTTKIKNFMSANGTPLTNYKFFTTIADDFWIRDFGPLGFYYDGDDKVGFLDLKYYPGRDNDNVFPEFLAGELGYKNVHTNLYAEGGNYMSDGFGNSFYSSVITSVNAGATPAHSGWTRAQTTDTLKRIWASPGLYESQTLECDGGTGHNDMFMKLIDEVTFAVMEYPSIVTAKDKATIDKVINQLLTTKTIYNTPYRVFQVPMPTADNGKYTTTCAKLNEDARTYVNGLTLNKTYLMPIYSDDIDGNKAGDAAAIAKFQKIMPGYKIVPVDSRGLTILGGAVHCVTMQIPAENPIHFWHPPVVDIQPIQPKYHIMSKITNKSGIASTTLRWRVNGGAFTDVTLTDSSGYWIGDITGTFSQTDVIEYYLSANSNNGKTMTKPIVADNGGYYSFFFQYPTTVSQLDEARNFAMNPVPNPTTGAFYIPLSLQGAMDVQATVVDVFGKKVSSTAYGTLGAGMSKLSFDLQGLPSGMYFIHISVAGQVLTTKKLSLQ